MKNTNLEISNLSSKKVVKAVERKYSSEAVCPTETTKMQYSHYSPKVRQQVMSNKLLNTQLYALYTVRKLHCEGKWLKANIVDGTIKIAKKTYIISWLDILPMDAYKEEAVVVSLRIPKYRDSRSKEYPLAYAVVSKIVE